MSDIAEAERLLRTMAVALADAVRGDLPPTGPRVGADSGDPQTATLTVFEGHGVEVCVWTCTPGGWLITDRPTTEAMLLLEGAATITPVGGEPVHLVAGDVFVLPKGWSGRWDITEPVRKFAVLVS